MTQIILDACNNHLGNDDIIVAMIKEAKRLGADYIKFQLFASDELSMLYPNYDEYKAQLKKCQITESKLKLILDNTLKSKIKPMFTIFSQSRIPFLKKHIGDNMEYAVKIASCDMMSVSLIKNVLDMFQNAPVYISCGMHSKHEIKRIREIFTNGYIHWLYCISMYPTPPQYIDFEEMELFNGFSDHTKDINSAMKALAIGTDCIEMHFTLGRSLPCKDSIVSKIPSEIEQVINFRNYLDSINKYKYRYV